MNHKTATLAATAIVAAMVVTGIAALATPQQVFAGGHHHHNNGVKVSQSINQANLCSGQQGEPGRVIPTICLNNGNNSVDIQH